jgi:hypothetical protein
MTQLEEVSKLLQGYLSSILDSISWLLNSECCILSPDFWMLYSVSWLLNAVFWLLISGCCILTPDFWILWKHIGIPILILFDSY